MKKNQIFLRLVAALLISATALFVSCDSASSGDTGNDAVSTDGQSQATDGGTALRESGGYILIKKCQIMLTA